VSPQLKQHDSTSFRSMAGLALQEVVVSVLVSIHSGKVQQAQKESGQITRHCREKLDKLLNCEPLQALPDKREVGSSTLPRPIQLNESPALR
jgi:hypothetical protein